MQLHNINCQPEEGFALMHDSLVALVILVSKQRGPLIGKIFHFHGKTVILSRNETPLSARVCAGLIVPTVSVPRK